MLNCIPELILMGLPHTLVKRQFCFFSRIIAFDRSKRVFLQFLDSPGFRSALPGNPQSDISIHGLDDRVGLTPAC